MGQKTERIKELEGELAAARYLLRSIGDTMGVTLDTASTIAETLPLHKEFMDALRQKRAPSPEVTESLKQLAAIRGTTVTEVVRPNPLPRRSVPSPGGWDTHDDLVDEQIDRLEAQGLTKPRDTVPSGVTPIRGGELAIRDNASPLSSSDLAPTIQGIATELGLNIDEMSLHESLVAIHEEILRVKNMGADVEAEANNPFLSSGKSLGQAIAHDHAQSTELRDSLTQARTIVNRLAAVMQVDKWDKDGTELLERAQRWEGWKHELKQRIRSLRATPPYGTVTLSKDSPGGWVDVHKQVADELDRHLQRLLSTKEMADWLKTNEKMMAAAPKPEIEPSPPYPFEFTNADCSIIARAMDESLGQHPEPPSATARERILAIAGVFREAMHSVVGRQEFARTMNVIILPILARQRAAQRPADTNAE
jgi:hypothetical protein